MVIFQQSSTITWYVYHQEMTILMFTKSLKFRNTFTQQSLTIFVYSTYSELSGLKLGQFIRLDDFLTFIDITRRSSRGDCDRVSQYSRGSYREYENGRTRYEIHEPDINVMREKRTQKYLVSMVTMYAICLCPLMILRLARLALVETYDNSGQFDLTYTIFVWVAFVPTCSTPLLFATWQMSRYVCHFDYFRY